MTCTATTFTLKMTVFWAFLQIIILRKSANSAYTVGLYAKHMYGEVEDLTLHITSSSLHILLLVKAQHTNGGKDTL
jgi:hypothetical protein